tara:strand:- start:190 stop:1437 length:1248 start_codon:yes stop_codon:yes gene_type:complete
MARPNPRYEPTSINGYFLDVGGIPRPRGQPDEFIDFEGHSRNFALEEKIQGEFDQVTTEVSPSSMKAKFPHTRGEFLPSEAYGIPSWWGSLNLGDFYDESNYGWGFTHQTALKYLELSRRYSQASHDLMYYHCHHYPEQTSACQNLAGIGGQISRLNKLIPMIEARITGFQLPEILPQVFGEEEPVTTNGIIKPEPTPQPVTVPTLSPQVLQIINDISNQKIIAPTWFVNNTINWVISGQINEQEFLTAYNNLVEQGLIYPVIDDSITDNMVTQKLDYFTIENGRAIGQITFTATENFNPNWYGKNIVNIIKFEDRNGANILPTVKQNNLRFTATERIETIQYDEGMNDNIYSKVSSFVWSSATTPTPFSKLKEFEIREKEPPRPISSGIMGAGVAGAIGILILLGFVTDSGRKK